VSVFSKFFLVERSKLDIFPLSNNVWLYASSVFCKI
jgi:hypothetical protein